MVCNSVLSYFDRNGSYISTRRIADQCGRNIIAQKAPVIRANENLNIFRIISSLIAEGQVRQSRGRELDLSGDQVLALGQRFDSHPCSF